MTCSHGRTNPTAQTKLRLFADSGGYCQRPNCRRRLFSDEGGKDYHIAEMAHIFAATNEGPRADTALSESERSAYENLILLCPNCHTEIDKAPDIFTDQMITEWKNSHVLTIKNILGVAQLSSRDDARNFIKPILRANKLIFEQFGPDNDYSANPEAEEAYVWKRKMLSQIIPNNRKMILFIDANLHLIKDDEHETVELFRQHVDDLIHRHIGDNENVASRFPSEMNNLFEG